MGDACNIKKIVLICGTGGNAPRCVFTIRSKLVFSFFALPFSIRDITTNGLKSRH